MGGGRSEWGREEGRAPPGRCPSSGGPPSDPLCGWRRRCRDRGPAAEGRSRRARQGLLTDAHRRLAGPPVVLQADADGGADEPEAGLALVHHGVPVAEAVTADVAVHRGVRGAAVAGWGQRRDR